MKDARRFAPLTLACLLVLAVVLAGCMGGGKRADPSDSSADGITEDTIEDLAFGTLFVEIVGFDRPDGVQADPVPITFTLDHVGLLHDAQDDWVPLLDAPASVEMELTETVGDAVDLGVFPVPAGTYSALELLASAATIDAGDGATSATTSDAPCFTSATITVPEDGEATITIVLSGPDAFVNAGGWTFKPASSGVLTEDGEGGFGEPDCS